MAINPIAGGPNPVSGVSGIQGTQRAQPTAKPGFQDTLQTYMKSVDKDQHASSAAVKDLLSGKSEDVLPAVAAMAKADMSFKLLVGVRNKMIEAYQQTLNMQV